MKNCMRSSRNEHGGAVVETALMLLIMVPLLFYVFLMSDVSNHLLEIQETVITTTWDFSTAPYGFGKKDWASSVKGSGSIDSYNRQQYTDHESAYIDFEHTVKDQNGNDVFDYGSADPGHHNQPFAHACWLGPNGQGRESRYSQYYSQGSTQVACEKQNDMAPFLDATIEGLNTFRSLYEEGGRFNCWAKGWVLNYLIPTTFMPEFNQTPLFGDKTKFEKGTDSHENSVASGNNNLLLRARASIVADSWAALKDHSPADSGSHRDYTVSPLMDLIGIQIDIRLSAGELFQGLLGAARTGDFKGLIRSLLGAQSDLHGRVGSFFIGGLDLLGKTNSEKSKMIIEYQDLLGDLDLAANIGVPQPASVWMSATYSHRGSQYDPENYAYKPNVSIFRFVLNPIGGLKNWLANEHYTTPAESYLNSAQSLRKEYYLGKDEAK